MHVVAEDGAAVGIGVVVEIAPALADLGLERLQQHVPVGLEGPLVGPDLADDLEAGVAAVGLDAEQPAAGPEAPRERGQNLLHLEVGRHPRAVGLRGDDQIVALARAAGARDDRVEQEPVILAVEHQHRGADVERIAGLRACADPPGVGEGGLKVGDLLVELVGGVAR